MKTLMFILVAIVAMSCEIIVEPRYDDRDLYTGHYSVNEYSETFDESLEYDVWISKSVYGNDIVITNFYNSDLSVTAFVSGSSITIPLQTVDGYEIKGDGYLSGNHLNLSYRVRDTYVKYGPNDFCSSTAWRY